MSGRSDGLVQSIQTRLVRHAHDLEVDPNVVLTRYAVERLLYRLSLSSYSEQFVLKGALLMVVWLGETIRPTRDADLLGYGELTDVTLVDIFRSVCRVRVDDDGMEYLPDTVQTAAIRPADAYGGTRITLQSRLGKARLPIQVDVGIGDAVSPAPELLTYPSLLEQPAPRLMAYPPETAIAEKLHAMVLLGSRNSRVRDYFDVHALAMHRGFSARGLRTAITATFERRRTVIPGGVPVGLSHAFASTPEKTAQWRAFRARNRLATAPADFTEVVTAVAAFLLPMLALDDSPTPPEGYWP